MSNENCGDRCAAQVVEAYFQSHDACHFAEHAEVEDMAQRTLARGRDAIAKMLRRWYGGDFLDAHDEPRNMIATDDTVVAEWDFHGNRHADPTHTEPVVIPVIAVFEVADGQIQRARWYYDPATLIRAR